MKNYYAGNGAANSSFIILIFKEMKHIIILGDGMPTGQ